MDASHAIVALLIGHGLLVARADYRVALTKKGRERWRWEPRRTTIRRLATASFVSVGVVRGGFVVTLVLGPAQQDVTLGLFERLLFSVDVALLLTMVRPLR